MARAGKNWQRMIDNLGKLIGIPSRITKPIAARLTIELQKEFKQGANSYGSPWVKLKPSTIRKKGGSTLIMIDTGKTRDETRAIALPGAGIGFVSTDYAGYHMGPAIMVNGKKRPARPILPHRTELPDRWKTIIRQEWERAFKQTMRR